LDPLKGMLVSNEVYGLIVIDKREATIGMLKGTQIEVITNETSGVPGKVKAGGQCITPDTLLQLSDGNIVSVKDVHTGIKAVNLKDYTVQDTTTVDKWKTKKEIQYKIITKSPRNEIICSKDHVFFVRDGTIKQKSAEELRVGNILLTPEVIPVNNNKQRIDRLDLYQYEILREGRELLKKYRIRLGLYQRQLAHKLGFHQVTISDVELGDVNLNRDYLYKLCIKLGIDFKSFITNYTEPKSKVKIPSFVTQNLAQITGYYIGDGNIDNSRICFSEGRKDLAEYYLKYITNYFRAKGGLKYRKDKNYYEIRVYGRPIERLFRKYFPKNKGIPEIILKSPNNVLAAFLKGFFDAEGYVSGRVALGIHDKLLAKQVQLSLLRFGVISSLEEYDSRRNPYSKKHRHTVEVVGKDSIKRFNLWVGFRAKDKQLKLKKLILKKSDKEYVKQILVPGSEIKKLIEKYGLKLSSLGKYSGGGFFWDKRELSKFFFSRNIISKIKHKNLKNELIRISRYQVIPTKIKKIEIIKKPTIMYDVSTKIENFIANGLVVHNSAARYSRLREEAAKEFYNRVNDICKQSFLGNKELKGILIGKK
ncbi:helix-turn-helix domain-containing protein, partial [Candidatus Woesearchaeota archaeon]|nr:helix-turn-helix domain-containing protein [Candidatus Woesearchaeota archaeon]